MGRPPSEQELLPLPPGADVHEGCPYPPGSPEKMAYLQHRYAQGVFPMHHPDDCRDHSPLATSQEPSATSDTSQFEDDDEWSAACD